MTKLSKLKEHSLFPFLDFEENDESFLLLELFWTSVTYEALGEEVSQDCIPIMDADRDGNPILFFWNTTAKRAIRVILFDVTDGLEDMVEGRNYIFTPVYAYAADCMTSYTSSDFEEIDMLSISFDMKYHEYITYVVKAIRDFIFGKMKTDIDAHVEKIYDGISADSLDEMNKKYTHFVQSNALHQQ